jgi:FtsP/CotA-like multicopper oxidase with cupredoxin domain
MSASEYSLDHISRRQAIKLLGTGTALAFLAGCGPFGSQSTGTKKVTAPTGGAIFTQPSEIVSRDGLLSVDLTAAESMLPWNNAQRFALTYNGTVHGPTLRAQPGDTITVNFTNNLNEPTNLHTHGLHVSPSGAADNMFRMIDPGDTQTYQYEIPANHPSGTYWYHPHHHGRSAPQLAGGLSGVLIIEDEVDDVPHLKNTTERVIVLSDPSIGTDSSLLNVSTATKQAGREGDVVLVNGVYQPSLSARTGETELWRIVNASTSRYHLLSLEGAGILHVGNGQERFPTAIVRKQLLLTPGQRCEVLVQVGSAGAITLKSTTVNRGMQMGGMGNGNGMGGMMHGNSYKDETITLLTLEATGADAAFPTILPTINPKPTPLPKSASKTRRVAFGAMSMGNAEFVIDGKSFDEQRIDYEAALGTTEDWVITNGSMMTHPFHLHVWPFQVISMSDGSAPPEGWHDTINVPTGESVTIRIPFSDYDGKTVYHCHILDHEDLGMMGVINVQ